MVTGLVDHERTAEYTAELEVVDSGNPALAARSDCILTIRNLAEPPIVVLLSNRSIAEMSNRSETAVGTVVGEVIAFDEDTDHDISIRLAEQLSPAFGIGNNLRCNQYLSSSGNTSTDHALGLSPGRSYTRCSVPLVVAGPIYHADGPSRQFVVLVTDGAGEQSTALEVRVINVNDQPVATVVSTLVIPENTPADVLVSEILTVDLDVDDTMNYTLSGPGAAAFKIVGSELVVRDAKQLDFEQSETLDIIIITTDSGVPPLSITSSFQITVQDVNEAPTAIELSNASFGELVAVGELIAVVTVADPDNSEAQVQSHQCQLVGDPGPFVLEPSGEIRLGLSIVDFEREDSYQLELQCTDTGVPPLSITQVLKLDVANENEAPISVDLSGSIVPENAAVGTAIGVLTTTDPDNAGGVSNSQRQFQYTVSCDAAAAVPPNDPSCPFKVLNDTAVLVTTAMLDYEQRSEYAITMGAADSAGERVQQQFVISVQDVNDVPTEIVLDHRAVPEGMAGAVVGKLSTVDPDENQIHTYTLVDLQYTDGGLFVITGDRLGLSSEVMVDYEATKLLRIRVKSTDNGEPFQRFVFSEFAIEVQDKNEPPGKVRVQTAVGAAPSSVALVREDTAAGETVGHLVVSDPDNIQTPGAAAAGSAAAYQAHDCVVSQPAATSIDPQRPIFSVSPIGALVLDSGVMDFEAGRVYLIQVTCTDNGTPPQSGPVSDITLQPTNVNEAPYALTLAGHPMTNEGVIRVSERMVVGGVIGKLSVKDPDNCNKSHVCFPAQTHVFSVDSVDSAVAAVLDTDGDQLVLEVPLDFESQPQHTIRITATDSGTPARSTSFDVTVEVVDANDAPTGVQLQLIGAAAGASGLGDLTPAGTVVGKLKALDDDSASLAAGRHRFELEVVELVATGLRVTPMPFTVRGDQLVVSDAVPGGVRLVPGATYKATIIAIEETVPPYSARSTVTITISSSGATSDSAHSTTVAAVVGPTESLDRATWALTQATVQDPDGNTATLGTTVSSQPSQSSAQSSPPQPTNRSVPVGVTGSGSAMNRTHPTQEQRALPDGPCHQTECSTDEVCLVLELDHHAVCASKAWLVPVIHRRTSSAGCNTSQARCEIGSGSSEAHRTHRCPMMPISRATAETTHAYAVYQVTEFPVRPTADTVEVVSSIAVIDTVTTELWLPSRILRAYRDGLLAAQCPNGAVGGTAEATPSSLCCSLVPVQLAAITPTPILTAPAESQSTAKKNPSDAPVDAAASAGASTNDSRESRRSLSLAIFICCGLIAAILGGVGAAQHLKRRVRRAKQHPCSSMPASSIVALQATASACYGCVPVKHRVPVATIMHKSAGYVGWARACTPLTCSDPIVMGARCDWPGAGHS